MAWYYLGSKQGRKLRWADPKFYDSAHDATFGTECDNAHVLEVLGGQAQEVIEGHVVFIKEGGILGQPAAFHPSKEVWLVSSHRGMVLSKQESGQRRGASQRISPDATNERTRCVIALENLLGVVQLFCKRRYSKSVSSSRHGRRPEGGPCGE